MEMENKSIVPHLNGSQEEKSDSADSSSAAVDLQSSSSIESSTTHQAVVIYESFRELLVKDSLALQKYALISTQIEDTATLPRIAKAFLLFNSPNHVVSLLKFILKREISVCG